MHFLISCAAMEIVVYATKIYKAAFAGEYLFEKVTFTHTCPIITFKTKSILCILPIFICPSCSVN